MTLHELLTEEAKKNGISDDIIQAAHAFSKKVIEMVGGDDKKVSHEELTPEDERMYREYYQSIRHRDGIANRGPSEATRPQ